MDAFRIACDEIGLVGSRLQQELATQVQAAVLARRGRDVVRLTGSTGSGKELVSALIHQVAQVELGRKGELVEVSCSNLPAGLFESTLFGHRRGAFTGATTDTPGLLARAQGGTLVFDEVQNLSLDDQGRLLRLIGEREYRSVGASAVQRTDAMIVLVSNIDLVEAANDGLFRRDLLDRAPAKIALPPLWQRREDIGELAQAFAQEAARDREWKDFDGLTRRALADLEGAVVEKKEASVRRLRELIRDVVFSLPEQVPEVDSSALAPHLESTFGTSTSNRDQWDQEDFDTRFDLALEARTVERLANLHGVPERTLIRLANILREVYEALPSGENPVPGSYRNLVSRMGTATKAALWLMSGASNQAEFRRFFGTKPFEMPPKSVAWQIYHDLFSGEKGGAN